MNIDLLAPRYKVIAKYPQSGFKVGDIWPNIAPEWTTDEQKDSTLKEMSEYPHLFKKLEWWEHRTIEQLTAVKYVKVITYRGYWRVGDIVSAKFYIGSIEKAKPTGYVLEYNHYQPIMELEPATEEQYLEFKKSGKLG